MVLFFERCSTNVHEQMAYCAVTLSLDLKEIFKQMLSGKVFTRTFREM